ncbi:MAG TPA: hypothetical protein VK736_11785 [Candidatus Binatia bacterium]|nr:hypothetical protein [Candidatus Binatia bacterium]
MTLRVDYLSRWLPAAIQVGTLVSAVLMLTGVLLGIPMIAWYGLLLLTLTPVLQLGVAVVGFGRLREPRYSLIAAVVLTLLLAALAAAALLAPGLGG